MTSLSRPEQPPLTEMYMDQDGETVFLPTGGWSWNAAQAEARRYADDCEPGWKAVYSGTQRVPIHDHDEPWESDGCPRVDCYVFEVMDR